MGRSVLHPYVLNMSPSAALTATANGTTYDFPTDIEGGAFWVKCSAASGTSPTLDVSFETSPDGGTTWFIIGKMAQRSAAGQWRWKVSFKPVNEAGAESVMAATGSAVVLNTPIGKHLRAVYTIGGTNPSFTLSVYFIGYRRVVEA